MALGQQLASLLQGLSQALNLALNYTLTLPFSRQPGLTATPEGVFPHEPITLIHLLKV
jgi:hypothetical protein